jgi:hypothetical protein
MRCTRSVLGASATAAAFAALSLAGSGVAVADSGPDVTGQKYADAQSALSGAGLTPVVASTVGDQKAWPDCVVTRAQKRTVQPTARQQWFSDYPDAGVAQLRGSDRLGHRARQFGGEPRRQGRRRCGRL